MLDKFRRFGTWHIRGAAAAIAFGILGVILINASNAATNAVGTETESGTRTSNVTTAPDAAASGGSGVKFAATPTGSGSGSCIGSNNAPGSPDPWGGCWPGPQNTGVPQGLAGDSRPRYID